MLDHEFFAATPGGPRAPSPDQFNRYGIFPFQASMVNNLDAKRPKDKEFQASGTHITVLRLAGPDLLGVSVGAKDNPFIPIREGMCIGPRAFDTFRVRMLSARTSAFPNSPETFAWFATSFGPLVHHPGYKRRKFEPGMWTVTTDVDNTPTDLLSPTNISTLWASGATQLNVPSLLHFGGTLRLHNRGDVPVFLYFGRPNVADNAVLPIIGVSATLDQVAWQLDPGQKEEFEFESGILWAKKNGVQVNDRPFDLSLFAQTAAGTVRVACLFSSPVRDLTDPDVDPIIDTILSIASP